MCHAKRGSRQAGEESTIPFWCVLLWEKGYWKRILLCIFCGIRFGVVGCVCGKRFCEPFLVDLLEEEVGFGRFLWVFFWCVSVLVVAL
ncbi:unnamed protein product [Sphagnum tenellum]